MSTCCWEGENQDCTGLPNLALVCRGFFTNGGQGTPAARRSQIRSPVQTSRPEPLWRHLCGLMEFPRQAALVRPAPCARARRWEVRMRETAVWAPKINNGIGKARSGLRLELLATRGSISLLMCVPGLQLRAHDAGSAAGCAPAHAGITGLRHWPQDCGQRAAQAPMSPSAVPALMPCIANCGSVARLKSCAFTVFPPHRSRCSARWWIQ